MQLYSLSLLKRAGNYDYLKTKNKCVLKSWKNLVEILNAVGKQNKGILEMLHAVLFKL